MAIVISDTVLDELTCDICEKYLSVLPINVFPNRRSVCGRCTKNNPEWNGTSSSFNIIAEKTLFKCVNRFDGCRELLRHSEVVEHEKVCLEKKYICPLCPQSDEIPTFLLFKHFQKTHKNSVLKNPFFSFNLNLFSDVRNVFIYRFDDYLFFFYVILNRIENFIKVKVVFLGDEELASLISYKFDVNLSNENLKICSNTFKCKTYKNDNDGFYKINIKDVNNFVNIEIDLNFSEKSLISVPKVEKLQIIQNSINLTETNIKVSQESSCSVIQKIKKLQNPSNITNNNMQVFQGNSCLVMEKCDFLNLLGNIEFTPITKCLTFRKLKLSSDFMRSYPEYSLTECEFGLVKENKVFFPVCINCNQVFVVNLYVSKQYKHSLCRICFHFLLKQNLINQVKYELFNLRYSLEYFCSCNCGRTFNYSNSLYHEWEMQKNKIMQKCFKCEEIHNLGEIVEHMEIKHGFNGRLKTDFCFTLKGLTNVFVFVYDQLIFVEKIEHLNEYDVLLHFNKIKQQNIIGLLFQYNYNYKNVLKFENFITVQRNGFDYSLTLICS